MEKLIKQLFFPFLVFSVLPLFFGLTVLTIILLNIIFAFYTARYGLKFSAFGLPIFCIFAALLCGIRPALFVCFQSVPALVMGALFFKKVKFSTLMIVSTISELFVLLVYSHMVSTTLGTEPAHWLFQDSVEQMRQMLLSSGQIDGTMATEIEFILRQVLNMMQTMLPCFYILFAVCLMYVLFNIVRYFLAKQNIHLDTMPRFFELWLPRSISNIFLVLFLLSMFTDSPILLNVVSVMFSIHVICGISVVDFYLVKRNIPRAVRALILGAILAFSPALGGFASTILCLMGMNNGMRAERK